MRHTLLLLSLALALLACSDDPKQPSALPAEDVGVDANADGANADDAGDDDAATDHDAANDAGPVATVDADDTDTGETPPNIAAVLDCGDTIPGGAGPGELQRYALDTTAFPDAVCNDGTPATVYFRPYRGEANRDRWVINLRGGGSCGSGASCAARWCSCATARKCPHAEVTTNFGTNNMSANLKDTTDGGGMLRRDHPQDDNPIEDYNQVRITYCSSDGWGGTRRNVIQETVNPVTGAPVRYSIHFLGRRILDSAVAVLRPDGADPLHFTLNGADTELPDLDDAVDVIIAGDSAGGAGVIANLDQLAGSLRAHNTRCAQGNDCPLEVRGVLDAIVGPDKSTFDYSEHVLGEFGVVDYSTWTQAAELSGRPRGQMSDESCQTWHETHRQGTVSECSDLSHVIRHHVTTPFFVRMALLDGLISNNYLKEMLIDPEFGALTLQIFALRLQQELSAFPMLSETAEEGAEMPVAPGVFAPECSKHDTIWDDAEVFDSTIPPLRRRPAPLV